MFKIEFNKTIELGVIDIEDASVSEAIWSTYPDYKSDVFIHWKGYQIELDKRGDISTIYNDIIDMLEELINNNSLFKSGFLSSTFTAYWNFKVEERTIKIKPQFFVASIKNNDMYLANEEIRKLDLDIEIDFDYFISEWSKLLKSIKEDLLKVGYTEDLENFEYLKNLK
ncbi:hypothetical protein LF887_15395 [Chryseobacterium sp. MEBOG06]|uniref:hypothetical protein n=1 Tax=Chryseobacterium sp. MEBOG06 TaxID=2879938 RepID=UPI001F309535|nr:hypothetical protein [Chryseobacterium sp. MEBOG06]UKB82389.1 hypothetical protein LF887_15395 [Chryseobacterium sp. MEBOG06]